MNRARSFGIAVCATGLAVALGLKIATHDAEGQVRHAVFRNHGGDDRLERPLARLEPIGVIFIERKERATILQCEAEFRRGKPRTESEVIALNQRNAIAILIDDAEKDRIREAELGVASRYLHECFIRIE